MSTYTPIFDRTSLQVAWLLNEVLVQDLAGEKGGSIKRDGSFFVDGEHVGSFSDGKFFDLNGLVVEFSDPTLAQDEQPTQQNCVSPVLANPITSWSNRSWSGFLAGEQA